MRDIPKESDFEVDVTEEGLDPATVTMWEAYWDAKDKWMIEAEQQIKDGQAREKELKELLKNVWQKSIGLLGKELSEKIKQALKK